MNFFINFLKLSKLSEKLVELWHQEKDIEQNDLSDLEKKIYLLQKKNYELWHLEDKARDPAATDKTIADIKREIDKKNQERNDLIELIDDYLLKEFKKAKIKYKKDVKINTETPGSAIDRLTILTLKIYHMQEQMLRDDVDSLHKSNCKNKLNILIKQKKLLLRALKCLFDEIIKGQKKIIVYRQFKMYNDPNLNPEIYKNLKKK